ncbi:hypothetical protein CC85DRAFT_156690 [Cutaneotrichosporon oleaginosum]|uniref:Cyclin N-terminal domain-containing protein n=1 Tax=Cutaneotrichosporon oleaginosum TaxID=879819 RepID=A0A0J0XGW0_9TREE|nr:uncharacterized protein CC85DRAFT_156690 [Cutaneotrichosporon oleaginosum]KLT40330.1 hypothetical protein CC85DRAFT_156690 [Cutaneotrichosporon oleaginosum]TXT06505.1 hypothetical protein COLE_05836 [Cutaneotrichosporon oleaginosum]
MPPAPPTKFARTSIEGWSRKRSVSPATAGPPTRKMVSSSLQASPELISGTSARAPEPAFVPKRSDDGYYYEEEYREEHLACMLEMEAQTLAHPELMDQQPEIQWRMRPYLIDFIIEIHLQFRLRNEVLYLACNIIDRYVSRRVVYKRHYQLAGCAALWIAAKFEDSKERVPLVREFYDMCCAAYDQSSFIQMEAHIIETMNWTIGHPTADAWLRHMTMDPVVALKEDTRVTSMARYLMELTLYRREFIGVRPHVIAWGALRLARFILDENTKKPTPDFITPANDAAALRVAEAIDRIFVDWLNDVPLALSDIVVKKYSMGWHHRISAIVRQFYLDGHRYRPYPETPSTPCSTGLPTPSLTPSSWAGKRANMSRTSPSPGGSYSCSSSEAGDEPITPITPIDSHPGTVVEVDYVTARENSFGNAKDAHYATVQENPVTNVKDAHYAAVKENPVTNAKVDAHYAAVKENIAPSATSASKAMPPPSAYQVRPVLLALASSLAIPQRGVRRRSG